MVAVKCSTILILLVLCGCSGGHLPAPVSTAPVSEPYPIVEGVISVTLGDVYEIFAPPGSATAGSRWLAAKVTYKNKSGQSAWVGGYSEESPFYGIETRPDGRDVWHDYGLAYCGNGAGDFEIPPGASHSFEAALPERFTGQEFRVSLPYRKMRGDRQFVRAVSDAGKLALLSRNEQSRPSTHPTQ
jgi:hypothetical protein